MKPTKLFLLGMTLIGWGVAYGAEVHVLAPSVVRSSIGPIIERYEAESGNTVVMHYGGTGLLLKQLADGGRADVVVLPSEATDQLMQQNQLAPTPSTVVGEVGIGVAVAANAPTVDVSTPDALKRLLLSAHGIAAIAPGNSTSGKQFAAVLDQLGIAKEVSSKLVLVDQGFTAEKIVQGQADVAVQQMTELLSVPGVRIAGPLPKELQKTSVYVASICVRAQDSRAAAQFLRALGSSAAHEAFVAHGFSAVQVVP